MHPSDPHTCTCTLLLLLYLPPSLPLSLSRPPSLFLSFSLSPSLPLSFPSLASSLYNSRTHFPYFTLLYLHLSSCTYSYRSSSLLPLPFPQASPQHTMTPRASIAGRTAKEEEVFSAVRKYNEDLMRSKVSGPDVAPPLPLKKKTSKLVHCGRG